MNAVTRFERNHAAYAELPKRVRAESTPPPGDVSHAELLQRVRVAMGWTSILDSGAPIFVYGAIVIRTFHDHEEVISPARMYRGRVMSPALIRRYRTHTDKKVADDLEDLADELGVLADHERLADAPTCSRCRSWEVEIFESGYYGTQCERCITWSRTTRKDRDRCADCRRIIGDGDRHGSRCNNCHGKRQDRVVQEPEDHREARLVKRRYRWSLVPPWERRPRDW
jgi:hypothetical protein